MLPDSTVSIDDSRWPLRLERFVGTPTLRQYEDYLEECSAALRRGEKYITITDLSRGGIPTPEQRQRQVLWLQEYESRMRELLLGVAFVITSPLVRLSLSTVMHLKPMPVPYFITHREVDAVAWAGARLEEWGMRIAAERVRSQYGLPVRAYSVERVRSA